MMCVNKIMMISSIYKANTFLYSFHWKLPYSRKLKQISIDQLQNNYGIWWYTWRWKLNNQAMIITFKPTNSG